MLREPLESGRITISRASRQADFPASFQMIAAMNPCPCGYLGDTHGNCHCSAEVVRRYRGKISGPLLDRIDIHVQVNRPSIMALRKGAPRGEPSAEVRKRVLNAREVQVTRTGKTNALLTSAELDEYYVADDASVKLLEEAATKLPLSARAYQRVQRVSQTIADLAGEETVTAKHIAEALGMRQLDRKRI